MPRVVFENITKRYGTLKVLANLNLTVEDGAFLVLLGPSGCGKTTLLNLLAGLIETTDGRILIGDRDVTDLDPRDRGLAMVFQSYALYPTMSAAGNLRFGLAAQKLSHAEIESRVAWAAKLLQIEALLDRKPSQLSGGQRQRVAIGRALVKRSGVLLFDEPLSNLDAKLRTEMRLEIKKLHAELGQTVVYVTHDQVEALTMATQIAVMNGGVIQQFGTPDEIYDEPANLFVARFIGAPAMNVFDATAKSGAGSAATAVLDGIGATVDLSGCRLAAMPPDGARLCIGLRPEHFLTGEPNGAASAAQFDLPIRDCEKTGNDATAYLEAGGQIVAMRIDPARARTLKAGDRLKARFPLDHINVFDAQTGRRL